MPSVMSLAAQQYYGNPRNGFWRITGDIFGFDAVVYVRGAHRGAARRAASRCGMCCGSCRRDGSLDSAIEPDSMVANDFELVLRRASRDRSRVLQRRRGREELRPPRRHRPAAALPQAAVDQPGPDHALRRQAGGLARSAGRLGHRRSALRPRPRLLDLRAERQQRRLVEWPAHESESTSARRPRPGPTARPRPAGPSR